MRKRQVVLAGLLAGATAFAAGVAWHLLLDGGRRGVRALPDETTLLTGLARDLPEAGFYVYPGADADPERMAEAYRRLPHGILVYTPPREPFDFARRLAVQCASDLACGWIAAVLLSVAAPSLPGFLARVLFVVLLGAFATLAVDVPYWNWYGFPTEYLLGQLLDGLLGWGLAGLVLARLLRPTSAG